MLDAVKHPYEHKTVKPLTSKDFVWPTLEGFFAALKLVLSLPK